MPDLLTSDRAELVSLLGPPPADPRRRRALEQAARGLPELQGKAESLLGRWDRAEERLSVALERTPSNVRALCWRAEVRLLTGRPREALADLDRAVIAAPDAAAPRLLRCLSRLRLGETGGVDADLKTGLGPDASRPADQAMAGMVLLERGRGAEAKSWLDRAVRGSSEAGWSFGLRALIHKRLGRLDEARADLDKAVRDEPAAWMFLLRAEAANAAGDVAGALADLKRAAVLLPGEAGPHLQAARVHLEQAQYSQGLRCLDRAVALRPGDPAMLTERARARQAMHDLHGALVDFDAAVRLSPDNHSLRFERAMAAVRAGRYNQPGREFGPQERAFLLGFVWARRRQYSEAAAHFTVAASSTVGDFAQRASFYRTVCRVLSSPPLPAGERAGERGVRLSLCGLGYRQPLQASVAVVEELSRCRFIYSNLSDPRVAELLALFPAEIRPIVFRTHDRQADECAREVFKGIGKGGPAALVTRGNPLFYGKLAHKLVERSRREKIPCHVYGSVSVADTFLSAVPLDGAAGARVYDAAAITGNVKLETRQPVIIYNLGDADRRRLLLKRLRAAYASDRPCYLLAGSGELEFTPVASTVGALEAGLAAGDPAVTLLL